MRLLAASRVLSLAHILHYCNLPAVRHLLSTITDLRCAYLPQAVACFSHACFSTVTDLRCAYLLPAVACFSLAFFSTPVTDLRCATCSLLLLTCGALLAASRGLFLACMLFYCY